MKGLRPRRAGVHWRQTQPHKTMVATAPLEIPEINPSPRVQEFLSATRPLLINGEWKAAASGETFAVYNPASGAEIAQVAEGGAEDINQAVAAARKVFDDPSHAWNTMTPSERGKPSGKSATSFSNTPMSWPSWRALTTANRWAAKVADVPLSADLFHYMAGWATKLEGNTIPISVPYAPGAKFHAFTVREPVGVVGQVIPWNFPLLMAAWKLGPVLATGNCVVLKPAEQTPLTALRLGEILQEAGVPDGVVNIVTGMGETAGAALAAHDDVDKVAFTGSTEVGKMIVNAAAGNLKKVTLELGGKSPNIIFKDTDDLEATIAGAASAIFFNHGQCCCAGSRLYVEKDIFDDVVQGVSAAADAIKLGPGLAADTEMGPLVSDEQLERVTGYMNAGQEAGANCVTGGTRRGDSGYFVSPTVITDARDDMSIVREEILDRSWWPIPLTTPRKSSRAGTTAPTDWRPAFGRVTLPPPHRRPFARRNVWVNCYNI